MKLKSEKSDYHVTTWNIHSNAYYSPAFTHVSSHCLKIKMKQFR